MFDEIVREPVVRNLRFLFANHFFGKGAYGLHVLLWRGHAAS